MKIGENSANMLAACHDVSVGLSMLLVKIRERLSTDDSDQCKLLRKCCDQAFQLEMDLVRLISQLSMGGQK